jgi:hypothetical protein
MNGIARKQEKLVKKVVNLLAVETVDVNYYVTTLESSGSSVVNLKHKCH